MCLNSYINENMLRIHKPKCENHDITTTKTSSEPPLHWKDNFHKKPLYCRNIGHFQADNGINNSDIVNKKTDKYKQNPVCNGYYL